VCRHRLTPVRLYHDAMLLVLGVRYLTTVVATGLFHCPSCGGDRRYRMRRPRAWIHVFWIPVVPLRTGEEYVECDLCRTRYRPSVLEVPTSERLGELLSRGTRTAAAYVLTGLIGGAAVGDPADPAAADRGVDDLHVAASVLQRSLGPGYTPEMLAADLAAHREGSDFTVLQQLAPQLTVLGKESLLRGLADLLLAISRGEPDWRRLGNVAVALGITPTHLRGILDEASRMGGRARE
jgi:zinc-ribbon family